MAEVFKKCTSYGDLVAGSPHEQEFLQWLLAFLDTPTVWFHLSPVEVLYWEDAGTRIEVDGTALSGLAMPYSRSAAVEGRLVSAEEDVEGNIAVAEFPPTWTMQST